MWNYRLLLISISLWIWLAFVHGDSAAQTETSQRPLTVAVLDFAGNRSGRLVSDLFASKLASPALVMIDRDLARTAARGTGYEGSLNMSLSEAREHVTGRIDQHRPRSGGTGVPSGRSVGEDADDVAGRRRGLALFERQLLLLELLGRPAQELLRRLARQPRQCGAGLLGPIG